MPVSYTPLFGWWQAVFVVVIVGFALSLVVWAVSALVLDRWMRRRPRPSLLERPEAYRGSVAEEAHRWLEEQQG